MTKRTTMKRRHAEMEAAGCDDVDVRTQAEQTAAYEAWRVMWKRWHKGDRRKPEPEFYPRETYEVEYDTPDADGFWGRRLDMKFYVRAPTPAAERDAHDQVRARFLSLMQGQPHTIYTIDR